MFSISQCKINENTVSFNHVASSCQSYMICRHLIDRLIFLGLQRWDSFPNQTHRITEV